MDLSRFFPPSLLDQNFGLCISPDDLIFPSYNFHRTSYYRPWKWYMQRAEKDFGSTIHDERDKFKIALDVQHFQPNEINVKVADKEIIIEGKHEERQDNHGFISRQFRRRYFLPHDCNADSVFSSLSSDGVLTVTADKIKQLKNKETIVPIKFCDSCPNKDINTKIEKTGEIQNKANAGSKKSNMEIMLKEDHCCLLRPELLGAACASENMQTKKQADNIALKTSTEKCEQQSELKTSEKVDVACGKVSAAKIEKGESCGLPSKGKSEIAAGKTATGTCDAKASCLAMSEKVDTIATGITGTAKIESADKLLCGLSSACKSEPTEAVACGITSEVLSEKAESSSAVKSEITNIKSMLNETIQIQESSSSSSYSSTMASSIKETTEKISEIVSDISAQLKEAAENI